MGVDYYLVNITRKEYYQFSEGLSTRCQAILTQPLHCMAFVHIMFKYAGDSFKIVNDTGQFGDEELYYKEVFLEDLLDNEADVFWEEAKRELSDEVGELKTMTEFINGWKPLTKAVPVNPEAKPIDVDKMTEEEYAEYSEFLSKYNFCVPPRITND